MHPKCAMKTKNQQYHIEKSINIYVIILKIFFVFYDLHLSAVIAFRNPHMLDC